MFKTQYNERESNDGAPVYRPGEVWVGRYKLIRNRYIKFKKNQEKVYIIKNFDVREFKIIRDKIEFNATKAT